jgi:Tfp pilus assembly protein PilO
MNPRRDRYFTYIRPIFKNKFVKTYSSLIFSLITIAIFSYYALRPTVTTIFSLQKSIAEQTAIMNTLKEKVGALVSGKQNYENIPQPVKNKLENLVPDSPALPALINSLNSAAQTAQASISGIQINPVTLENQETQLSKTAPINEIDFSFSTEGSFADLMKVLTTLKRSDRLITISSVNFSQTTDSPLGMSVTGKAYYLKN